MKRRVALGTLLALLSLSLEQALGVHEFVWTYLLNSVVETWDAGTRVFLAKTAIFLAGNANADPQWHGETVARVTGILATATKTRRR